MRDFYLGSMVQLTRRCGSKIFSRWLLSTLCAEGILRKDTTQGSLGQPCVCALVHGFYTQYRVSVHALGRIASWLRSVMSNSKQCSHFLFECRGESLHPLICCCRKRDTGVDLEVFLIVVQRNGEGWIQHSALGS